MSLGADIVSSIGALNHVKEHLAEWMSSCLPVQAFAGFMQGQSMILDEIEMLLPVSTPFSLEWFRLLHRRLSLNPQKTNRTLLTGDQSWVAAQGRLLA